MREKLRRAVQSGLLPLLNRLSQLVSIPKDNDCCEQIKARHAIVLAFGGSVTDFALPAKALI
jgi:hypothetical protein